MPQVLDLITDAPAYVVDHRLDAAAGDRLAELLYGRPMKGLNTARHIFLEEPSATSTPAGTSAPSRWSGTCAWRPGSIPTTRAWLH